MAAVRAQSGARLMISSTFRDKHGVDLGYRQLEAPSALATIVIVHGASEHSARYERFADALCAAGFNVYALDLRGHGQTASSTGPGRMGPPGGEALVDDIDQLVSLAEAGHPALPIAVFGHSMGSLVALAYTTSHPGRVRSLVLCGLPAGPDSVGAVAAAMTALPPSVMDDPGPALAELNAMFEPARTPYDWLSRDPLEVDRYIADPLCGDDLPLTLGFMAELFSVVAPALSAAALSRISCPVHLIAGDRDPAAGLGEHVRQLSAGLLAVGVPTTSHLYPGARHELLNETNRDEVTTDIIAWLLAQLRPRGERTAS